MGKFFIACLATFVVLSFLWNSVAADEENSPAKKLLFDSLGMELHDPRKRKHYLGKHYGGPRHHGHRKRKGRGRSSGSDSSDSSGTSDSDSDSDSSDSGSDSDHGGKRRHGRKGKRGHGSDSDKHSSDEAEL